MRPLPSSDILTAMANTPSSIFFSVIGILASGLAGGLAGWSFIAALDWSGVGGALVAAAIGMVVATAVWLAITVLLRKLGLVR
jgi:hypothetical protein